MGLSHSPRIVTDSLVFCVDAANKRSYPGAGTTWTDLTANKNNGTLENMDATNFSNDNAGIFTFDGADENINMGDVLDMGLNSVTVCSFINVSSISNIVTIFSKSRAAGTSGRYWYNLQIDPSRLGKIRAGFAFSTASPSITDSTIDLRNTGWNMASVVWDRNGNMQVYINDILDAETDISSHSAVDMQSTDIMRIGGYNAADGTTLSSPFEGSMANCLYYNRALSAEEIKQNYLATKGRFQ